MDVIHPLKAYRERQEPPLTQERLAGLLGVSKAAVSRWEAGERKPEETILPTITERTGIPARELRPDLAELMSEPERAAS